MLRKSVSLFLCICISLACVAQKPAYKVWATEFEGSEDEYFELCKSEDLSKEEIQVCREFREYISEKQESLDNQIAANEEKINDLNLELDEVYTLIADVSKKIKDQQVWLAVCAQNRKRKKEEAAEMG